MSDPTSDAQQEAVSPGARRMRERRRKGLRIIPFHIRDIEIAALVRLGYVSPDRAADREALAVALGILLDQLPAPERWPVARLQCPSVCSYNAT
jgi:hypothetical protein